MDSAGDNTGILLVEDEGLIALAEAQMLRQNGYSVTTVLKGEDALQQAAKSGIDLVLMDINLGRGRMDGTEVARKILQKRKMPLIFLTSHSEKEYFRRVEDIDHCGYLLKHEGYEKILQTIEEAISLFRFKNMHGESN